ncbi:tetratricopeptide repeat protein [Moritella marina]|uniref:tetratricopeptide repeat protein n=1 Tax=Moritella marina TaxID=90736 RepID=UPI003704C806
MSVINQMLKGLDKESQQQQAAIERSGAVIVAAPKNDNKVAIALITSMVAVAALAAYLFMQKESKVEQQAVTQQQIVQARVAESAAEPELVAKPAIAKLNVDNATVTAPKVTVPVVTAPIVTESVVAQSVAVKSIAVQPITIQAPKVQQAAVRAPAKQVSAKNTQVVREVKPIVHDITDETVTEVADSVSIKAVTRTPTQQAGLYAKQAESALLAGDKIRAKELFVKVLAFDKQHDLAREKLAAILYGEQRTQSAVKLLQEGLSISPQYTNFRLMLARIYLKNNNKPQAYYYLKPHQPAVAGHVDYYAILAGLAQNLDDLDTALVAYKKLTVHEPNRAKWWLGLGITADKAQHVDLALNAYHTAQNMGQLSASSRNYINARITQLEKQ